MSIICVVIKKRILLIFFILLSIFFLCTFLNVNYAWAECGQPSPIAEQQFEILQNKLSEASCVGGMAKIPGCVLRLKSLSSNGNASKEYDVFAPEDICLWKKKEIKTLEIETSCCDTLEVGRCSEYSSESLKKDGLSKNACTAGVRYYVKKYRMSENGKAVVRLYNEQTKSFEVVAPKK